MPSDHKSTCTGYEPCPRCGSDDNVAVFDDGHKHCFTDGCDYHVDPSRGKEERPEAPSDPNLIASTPAALPKRKISKRIAQKFGYGVGEYKGKPVQVAPFYDAHGKIVAQKLRFADKSFLALGNTKALTGLLFGQHLWRAGGKAVVITEGEIDALSVAEIQEGKWPVVSIPNGCPSAEKAVRENLEWLESFERVVFMFDNDEHGRAAVAKCAPLLSPGKAHIATLPLKDASDMLVAGRGAEVVRAFWDARPYRPDGVLSGADVAERLTSYTVPEGVPYPFSGLNDKTYGLRPGEAVVICAGTGIGKSLTARTIAQSLIERGEKVGCIFLEDQLCRGALRLLSLFEKKPLFLPSHAVPGAEAARLWEQHGLSDKVAMYDHWGTIDVNVIAQKIRYMARAMGAKWFILDHISIMVSGDESDERRNLDISMTKLVKLIVELDVGLIIVCHLKRPPQGRGHEDGARTHLSDLRGTAGIGQLADIVIGQERDQQSEDKRHLSRYRVLKNRLTGDTGLAGTVEYDPETGTLHEVNDDLFEEPAEGDDGDL